MPLLEDRLKFGDDVSLALKLLQDDNKDNAHNVDIQKASQIAKQHLGIPLLVE